MQSGVIWFTGLSGSGKSTLAEALVAELKDRKINVEYLDGDSIREIFPETGFTREQREYHLKWVGFVAQRLERHGIIVVASFVSPYRASRDFVRSLTKNFFEIYVSTPLEECERRDVKGLYKKARNGEIAHFTGISDPYEPPVNPELSINTGQRSRAECLRTVIQACGF